MHGSRRPEQVHAVIAHEPPLDELLDDRDQLCLQTEDTIATYLAGDVRGARLKFLATANIHLPEEVFEAMFGGDRDPQTSADEHYQFAHTLQAATCWQPDIVALRSATTRILVGIGRPRDGRFVHSTDQEGQRVRDLRRTPRFR